MRMSAIRVDVRHRSTGIYVCSADEELYIRRNASIRHVPATASSSQPPKKSESNDEEQFDFVEQKPANDDSSDKSSSSLGSNHSESLPPLASSSNSGKQENLDTMTATKVNVNSNTNSGKGANKVAVKLFPGPAAGRVFDRARKETTRVILDSRILGNLHFPSQRETITLAGELAIITALLMLLRAGVSSTLRWVHTRINDTRGNKSNITYEASVFECMQRPLEFLSLFTVGTALAEAVSRPLAAASLLRHIRSLRELGVIIAATWFLLRWIDRIRSRFAMDKRIDKAQLDATARFAAVATFVVSLLISLDTIGINVQAVLAFGGIGGVAIGFAGREIISNFFSGFMIYVTRPFTVGEWIRCIEQAQLNGTVEDIGWYLTRVRTWDKRPLYIPNSRFSTLIVENGSRMDNRRIVHTLHIRLEDIPVASTIVSQMEAVLMSHPALDPKQHRLVYVDSYDDYSMQLWFSCYTKSVFLYDFRDVQQELLLKFYEIIRSNGAKLANRNTRDVRPGVDTDQYGPYGQYVTYGRNAQASMTEAEAALAQERRRPSLVDNVPYATTQNGETEHTAEDAAVNGAGIRPDGSVLHGPVGESNDEQKKRSRSEVAISAVASALAAAKRLASRIEERESAKGGASAGNTDNAGASGSSSGNGTADAKPASASGQMKISKAPPMRTPSSSANSPANTASAQNGNGVQNVNGGERRVEEDAELSKQGMKEVGLHADAADVSVSEGKEAKAGANQMKISKAPSAGRSGSATSAPKQPAASGGTVDEAGGAVATPNSGKGGATDASGTAVVDSKVMAASLKKIVNKAAERNTTPPDGKAAAEGSATDSAKTAAPENAISKSAAGKEAVGASLPQQSPKSPGGKEAVGTSLPQNSAKKRTDPKPPGARDAADIARPPTDSEAAAEGSDGSGKEAVGASVPAKTRVETKTAPSSDNQSVENKASAEDSAAGASKNASRKETIVASAPPAKKRAENGAEHGAGNAADGGKASVASNGKMKISAAPPLRKAANAASTGSGHASGDRKSGDTSERPNSGDEPGSKR